MYALDARESRCETSQGVFLYPILRISYCSVLLSQQKVSLWQARAGRAGRRGGRRWVIGHVVEVEAIGAIDVEADPLRQQQMRDVCQFMRAADTSYSLLRSPAMHPRRFPD